MSSGKVCKVLLNGTLTSSGCFPVIEIPSGRLTYVPFDEYLSMITDPSNGGLAD
jgi:hypothetical protein